ncbi:hypothetical protein BHM03_00001453 [Ensete ventricosum]|nr:hypothetical protein BHM03_00001453 [Ensete ventricosum]
MSKLMQATPRLSEDKVKQCVDPRLKGDCPPKAVAKVSRHLYYYFCMFVLLCHVSSMDHSMSVLLDSSEEFVPFMQLAAVAALCVQYEAEFRPNMSIVVKALSALVNKQVPNPTTAAAPSSDP